LAIQIALPNSPTISRETMLAMLATLIVAVLCPESFACTTAAGLVRAPNGLPTPSPKRMASFALYAIRSGATCDR